MIDFRNRSIGRLSNWLNSIAVLALITCSIVHASDRPNILWITSEDNSPYLGCYGDELAQTPNLDRLAAEGLRYRNAFANAPVCSAARSTLITGMYATTLGIQNHRSRVAIPDRFQLYPEVLRAAGYYCTNNSKTDYNIAGNPQPWDESGKKAHYRHRKSGQPFFAVFNFTTSHESKVAPKEGKTSFRIPPEKMPLPPYHPGTPEIRSDWVNYYDQMTLMDRQVGEVLKELKQEDLSEETIVFYYGDHGGALPRGKRNIHDSGTRVPLIIRFPSKWAHLSPAKPGSWIDDPVSFVDFPATVFSLCGIDIPTYYQGRPFLGEKKVLPRDYVFLYRARMDERYDTVRSIRSRHLQYVRNYSPHRPWGQHYSYPFRVQPSMRSWFEEYQSGRTNAIQSVYWQPKPAEEFYRIDDDLFEIQNLINDPAQAGEIDHLRAVLHDKILSTRDTGFIPEGMYPRLAGKKTIYDYAQSDAYPLKRLLELANKVSDGDSSNLKEFITALDDKHPLIRYWAATGCLILKEKAAPAKDQLIARLSDDWPDVQLVAAEAVAYLGEQDAALKAVTQVLHSGNPYEVLAAENTLEYMWKAQHVSLSQAQDLMRDIQASEPGDRIPRYLLNQTQRNGTQP